LTFNHCSEVMTLLQCHSLFAHACDSMSHLRNVNARALMTAGFVQASREDSYGIYAYSRSTRNHTRDESSSVVHHSEYL
jgi:hypothetical protein